LALANELLTPAPIPILTPQVPAGLPSDLLRRRPDIRQAERNLAAATAQIGVATAQLFPTFSLTGSLGLESEKFHSVFSLGNNFWSIGPSVSWPIFDAGRIRANIAVANALRDQAYLTYQQTILTALQDVENSLVAYNNELVHNRYIRESVAANRRAVELATRLYPGLTDFLNVLTAQSGLFSAETALAQSDAAISTDLVALYKALGGGWDLADPPAPKTK
jgi:NodT family efflux transporter outer membrane factor (OMF) lipoprotein